MIYLKIIVYFLSRGKAGYVLTNPSYQGEVYLEIDEGDLFGHIDLVNTNVFKKGQKSIKNKHHHKRKKNFKSHF